MAWEILCLSLARIGAFRCHAIRDPDDRMQHHATTNGTKGNTSSARATASSQVHVNNHVEFVLGLGMHDFVGLGRAGWCRRRVGCVATGGRRGLPGDL
jgi:hypothetical protein